MCVIWVLGYLLVALFFRVDPSISRSFVFLVGLSSIPSLMIWRILAKQILYKTTLASKIEDRVLVIGSSKEQSHFLQRLESHPSLGFKVVEHVLLKDHETQNGSDKQNHRSVSTSEIENLVKTGKYDCVLLADNAIGQDKISYLIQLCHREMVRFLFIPMFFEVLISGLQLRVVSGVPLISIGKNPLDRFFNRLIKRIVDVVGALVGLLLFGPIILLFSLLVYRESPGPVFYSQIRAGRGSKKFKMYKIRSMRLDAEKDHGPQWAKENDGRRLIIGSFMRSWNIDELPQFWNVLKGDMSLVGPRPERPVFIKEFKDRVGYYNVRHTVKPGITGWAAINGWRGNTDLNERIRFDLDYIERWSLGFDIQIMILTFFRNKNAY